MNKMTCAHFWTRRRMTKNCDGQGTPVSDKTNSTVTYMLQYMINDESLAMIGNFVN